MAELGDLTKQVSEEIMIYPYKEVKRFPVYRNPESGKEEGISEGWKDVGFKCKYPTVERLRIIQELGGKGWTFAGEGLKIQGSSKDNLINWIMKNIIIGWTGVTQDGVAVDYESNKPWLKEQLTNSEFLLSNFAYEYRKESESFKTDEELKKDELEKKSAFSSQTDEISSLTRGDHRESPEIQ